MTRQLFNLSAVFSLSLFAILLALWVRSYSQLDAMVDFSTEVVSGDYDLVGQAVATQRGAIGVEFIRVEKMHGALLPGSLGLQYRDNSLDLRTPSTLWEQVGFWQIDNLFPFGGSLGKSHGYYIPIAVPLATLLILPLFAVRHRLRHRTRKGVCRNCGYNLQANVSRKCPECGTSVEKSRFNP